MGKMSGVYKVCFLISTFISKSMSATIGRSIDTETNARSFFPNNPFLNSSYPGEQQPLGHYYGLHHHHHHDGFYHNRNKWPNPNGQYQENHSSNDFEENSFPKPFSEGPKITSRRDAPGEEVRNYPYEEIRSFLAKNPLLRQFFAELPQIGNRDGAPPEEDEGESLCKMQVVREYYPKVLQNINKIDRVVVNDDREYKQAIQKTICANVGRPCSIPFDNYGYTSECHQNRDIKRLMVYENETKSVVFDEFKIPSCCVCKIKRTT